MKKLLLAGTVLMLLGTASLSYANIGIGYDGHNSAVSCRYWMEKYGFQGMLRINYDGARYDGKQEDKDGKLIPGPADYMLIDFTAKFLFPLLKTEKLWLNGVLSLGIRNYSGIGHIEDKTRMDTGFLVGISPEYYVLPNLSFETTFGIGGTMYGKTKTKEEPDGLGDDKTEFITFGSGLSFSTGLTFHYYFPEAGSVIEE